MKLELGKIRIDDIQFADKTYVKDHVLYVNKEEVEKLVLEDDKLKGCKLDIARPGEKTRITPVKDVIEPRVKVSGGGNIFPGVIGKVSPTVGEGRTHALDGCCVVTVGRIVGFQEGVIDMSGVAADYCPFSKTVNLCVVIEPQEGLETHVYEKAGRMAGLKVAAYLGEAGKEVEPDTLETFETKPIFEQAAMYPDLPKVGYVHMLQSQGLLHDTYYYGVDAKQFIPTYMYPQEIMDGAIVSGNCVAPCDKVTTYHHFHNPVIEDCFKHHGNSDMVAKLAEWMGLDGVLITEEGYGNPDTDLMMNCKKVQRKGVDVVLITDEFPGKDGKSQSLADVCDEANALASCGQGNMTLQFPKMDKIIGTMDYIENQIGGWAGCVNPDGSFEAEIQIIIASTIANGFNTLAARGY